MNQAIQQLVHAAFTGNVKLVRKILSDKNQKVDVNAANDQGTTALIEASKLGHVDIVRVLLKAGANPNWANSAGETAVHYAAQHAVPTVLQLLVAHGGDVNVVDCEGRTALHWACAHDALHTAEWLLSSTDIDVTVKNREGRNALMYFSPSSLAIFHHLTEKRYLDLAPLTVSDTEQLADEPPPSPATEHRVNDRTIPRDQTEQRPPRSSIRLSDIPSPTHYRTSEDGDWQNRYYALLDQYNAWHEKIKLWRATKNAQISSLKYSIEAKDELIRSLTDKLDEVREELKQKKKELQEKEREIRLLSSSQAKRNRNSASAERTSDEESSHDHVEHNDESAQQNDEQNKGEDGNEGENDKAPQGSKGGKGEKDSRISDKRKDDTQKQTQKQRSVRRSERLQKKRRRVS